MSTPTERFLDWLADRKPEQLLYAGNLYDTACTCADDKRVIGTTGSGQRVCVNCGSLRGLGATALNAFLAAFVFCYFL